MAYPLKLRYFPKTALWGGNTLKSLWNKPCDFDKLAETWELTVRPDATNLIENGEFETRTDVIRYVLRQFFKNNGKRL